MQESVVHKKERPLILETWRKHPVSIEISILTLFSKIFYILNNEEIVMHIYMSYSM